MPNREQFEAAACLEWSTEEPATLLARSIRADGYRSRAVDDAWRWWQAGAQAENERLAELADNRPENMFTLNAYEIRNGDRGIT